MLEKGQAQTGHLSCEWCFGITLHLGTACTQLAENGRNVHLRPQRWLWSRSCSPLEQPEYRSYETPEAQRFLMLSLKYSSSFTVQQLTNHARCLYELKALQKVWRKSKRPKQWFSQLGFPPNFFFLDEISPSVGKSCLRSHEEFNIFHTGFLLPSLFFK